MSFDFTKIVGVSSPIHEGRYVVRGLDDTVEIFRDEIGTPHIFAHGIHDGFFAQGFVQSQDRLWQMESDRLKAYGRMAQVIGESALMHDLFWRRLHLHDSARADYQASSPQVQTMFQSFTAGVNAFLKTDPCIPECMLLGHTPAPWTPWDAIAVFKFRHLNMGRWEHKLWRMQILQRFGAQAFPLLFPTADQYTWLKKDAQEIDVHASHMIDLYAQLLESDPDEGGSNNWVLAGSRTESGHPIMAGDPHRALDVPNVYYQNHLRCDAFDVIGFSFPGVPGFPHFGHNQSVAWSITHAAADTQDIYLEQFSDDGLSYLRNGRWIRCQTEPDEIVVRGQANVPIRLVDTSAGPIIRFHGNKGIALHAATLAERNTTWESLLSMLSAQDTQSLDAAMAHWVDPVNNLLYADTSGNIGYRMRGKLPTRSLTNAWLPVDASSSEFEWTGYVPYASMYTIQNPKEGYIVTANNQVVDNGYPHFIAFDFAAPSRRDRIAQLISSRQRWNAGQMVEIHGDVVSLGAQNTIRYLESHKPATSEAVSLWRRILDWNGTMDMNQVVPTLYATAKRIVTTSLLTSATNDAFLKVSDGSAPFSWQFGRLNGHLPYLLQDSKTPQANWARETKVWERALKQVAMQAAPAQWGTQHILQPIHPLSPVFPDMQLQLSPEAIPMGGDGDTVQAASYGPKRFQVTGISVARYVFDLGNWDNSGWVVPLGVSGVPQSTHYTDQAKLWAAHQLVPMYYSTESILSHATQKLKLVDETPHLEP